MSEHATFLAAVHIIIRQRETGKILFQRRQGTKLYCGWLGLPAGHVDAGEHPIEAAIREAKEELGIEVTSRDVAYECHSTRRYPDSRVYFDAYYDFYTNYAGEPQIMEPAKCAELVWLDSEEWQNRDDVIAYEKRGLEELRCHTAFFSQDCDCCEDVEVPKR